MRADRAAAGLRCWRRTRGPARSGDLRARAVDLRHRAGRADAREALGAVEARLFGAAAAGLGDEQVAAVAELEMARAVEPGRDLLDRTAGRVRGRRDPQRDQLRAGRTKRSARMRPPHLRTTSGLGTLSSGASKCQVDSRLDKRSLRSHTAINAVFIIRILGGMTWLSFVGSRFRDLSELNRLFATGRRAAPLAAGDGPDRDDRRVRAHRRPARPRRGRRQDRARVDRVLTVSGERKAEHEDAKAGYRRVERAFGSFSRSLTLPEGVDGEADLGELRPRRARGPHPEARAAQAAHDLDRAEGARSRRNHLRGRR